MGSAFEELIRRFSEQSNETAGHHFTPREVIRLMVDLLFIEDDDALRRRGVVKTLFDPACGTGGMLSVAEEYLRELNPDAQLQVFGQELNGESWAICNADMMIKGQNPENVVFGNSFSEDGHVGERFDYMLSNPPFGVDWKKVEKVITRVAVGRIERCRDRGVPETVRRRPDGDPGLLGEPRHPAPDPVARQAIPPTPAVVARDQRGVERDRTAEPQVRDDPVDDVLRQLDRAAVELALIANQENAALGTEVLDVGSCTS